MEEIIKKYLEERAAEDLNIAANLQKKTKSIERCCKYITEQARKQQKNGVAVIDDDVVFGWAIHYYDEDGLDIDKPQKKAEKPTTKVVTMPNTTKTTKTADKPQNKAQNKPSETAKVVQLDLF